MARKRTSAMRSARIAPLTPDSPDPEAREMAANAALMTLLEESSRRAVEPGGSVTAEELDRRRPLTPDERAEAEAHLDALERAELEEEPSSGQAARGRRRPAAANGRVLLRLPLSIHRQLIERAEAEHTSLGQLILAYLRRGLGQDAEGGRGSIDRPE